MLDLRTLKPLDENSIFDAAGVTGRVIVHSANQMAGVGAEVAALIAQKAFDVLDAPIMGVGAFDTPVPFSSPLENAHRPGMESICVTARTLARY